MQIRVENYRRFAGSEVSINADSPLVVVCGPNGAGKTTLVEAVGLAVYGETPDGASAASGRLVAHLSDPASRGVSASVELDGERWKFSRTYEDGALKRGKDTTQPGLPIRKTAADLTGLGVKAKRALGVLAGVLAGNPDADAQLETARAKERQIKRDLRDAQSRLDGALQVAGAETIPTDDEIAQLRDAFDRLIERKNNHALWRSKVDELKRISDRPAQTATPCAASWRWIPITEPTKVVNLRGECPHACIPRMAESTEDVFDRLTKLSMEQPPQPPDEDIVDRARNRLRAAEEIAKVGPAISSMQSKVRELQGQLDDATEDRERIEDELATAAAALDHWWSRFPVALRVVDGEVMIETNGAMVPAIGLSGAAGQWLDQIAIPSLILQSWPESMRILAADVDRLAVDQLKRAMQIIAQLHLEGLISGAVLATCHVCPDVTGWAKINL